MMEEWKLLMCAFTAASVWSSSAMCDTSPTSPANGHNRVNPGWYGWMGDFHDVRGYYPQPSDRAYYQQHHINWFLLSHQWVVPFLESDTYNVRAAFSENKHRTRIWYEAYWWGDHSAWERPDRKGFGMQHIPQHVLDKLERQGIRPGGDNIVGKDWVAAATDPKVMASIKKTIRWQLDTIIEHCGPDAIYGVVLSEEEPDHGIHVTLGDEGFKHYRTHRDEILPKMIAVHNELYDFVKAHYPQFKISPGFYPAWVQPGTLKMDAVVMDLYPPPGKEEAYIQGWIDAYGEVPPEDHYIVLWGYGDGDRAMEVERFDRITEGFIARGYRNLGFFRPELALRDRVHRLWDVGAAGTYAPYDIDLHHAGVETLWEETIAIARELEADLGDIATLPENARASRNHITEWTQRIYDYRETVLDAAYAHMRNVRDLAGLNNLVTLLKAESLIPGETGGSGVQLTSTLLNEWEALSKEYRTLPRYYEAVSATRAQMIAHARTIGRALHDALDGRVTDRYPTSIRNDVDRAVRRVAELVENADIPGAEKTFRQLFSVLYENKVEQSYQLRIVFKNGYDFPLNLLITLAAEWPDGRTEEIYSDYPCETADQLTELRLFLAQRPAAIRLGTCSWSGALTVHEWQLFNSRGPLKPAAVEDIDHIDGFQAWLKDESESFDLLPWASVAGARIVYESNGR